MTWQLESAEDRVRQAPSFVIPPLEIRRDLRLGDCAKLLFLVGEACERMWVEVASRDGDTYMGTLASKPVTTSLLQFGDEVEFRPEHVIEAIRNRAAKAR